MENLRQTRTGLPVNTRFVARVRAFNEFGQTSEWSEALDFTTPGDSSVPLGPSNLIVNFNTPDLILNWDRPTNNTNGTILQDLSHYEITLIAFGGVTKVYETFSQFFIYTFEQNASDFNPGSPVFEVELRSVDVAGNKSDPVTATAINPAPQDPPNPPQLVGAFTIVNVIMEPHPDDQDIASYLVEHSTNGFDFFSIGEAKGDAFSHNVQQGTTHHYRFRVRDFFGQLSGPSPSANISTDSAGVEHDPPSQPQDLIATPGIDSVTFRPYIDVSWTPNQELDLSHYELRVQKTGESFVNSILIGPGASTYRVDNLDTNTEYTLVIYAWNIHGLRSDVSASAVVTTGADDTPPDVPTGYQTVGAVQAVIVRWDANTEFDFSRYELYASQTEGFDPLVDGELIFSGNATSHHFSVDEGETWYFRLRAVDVLGNESGFTDEFPGSPATEYVGSIVTDNIVATGGTIGTTTITPAELSGGVIRGSEFIINAAGQVRFGASGSIVWDPDALGGIELSHSGYMNNAAYRANSDTGFNISNDGLIINEGTIRAQALQIGISNENLLRNAAFTNGTVLATDWVEHKMFPADGDYEVVDDEWLYLGKSQKITVTSGGARIGVSQDVFWPEGDIPADTPIGVSVWVKQTNGNARSPMLYVTDTSDDSLIAQHAGTTITPNQWINYRFVLRTINPHEGARVHFWFSNVNVGDVFYIDGAQAHFSDFIPSFAPASLDIPENYITNAHISSLSADKLTSGTISTTTLTLDGIDGAINNTAATFRIDGTGAVFQNGTISLVGAGGSLFLDSSSLRMISGGSTQFYIDDSGVFIGGSSMSTAQIAFDTTEERTVFRSNATGHVLEIDSKATFEGTPPKDGQRILRIYPEGNQAIDTDTFYITTDGRINFTGQAIGWDGFSLISEHYQADNNGWAIFGDGSVEFNNGKFRGHIEADSGSITTDLLVGTITADMIATSTLTSTTITLGSGGILRAGTTQNGVTYDASGITMMQGGVQFVSIPTSGSPTFRGHIEAETGGFGILSGIRINLSARLVFTAGAGSLPDSEIREEASGTSARRLVLFAPHGVYLGTTAFNNEVVTRGLGGSIYANSSHSHNYAAPHSHPYASTNHNNSSHAHTYWATGFSSGRGTASQISTVQYATQTRSLGSTSLSWAPISHVHASGHFQQASSSRDFKTDVVPAEIEALATIATIQPVNYRYIDVPEYVIEADPVDVVRYGVVVEDMPEVAVDKVQETGLDLIGYTTLLAAGIQELTSRLEALEEKIGESNE